MVIVRIADGLGNQFFQYATGLALARRLKTRLVLDASEFQRDKFREYELGHFQITAKPWTDREKFWASLGIQITQPPRERKAWPLRTARRLARWCLKNQLFTYVHDHHRGYEPGIFRQRGNVYLKGIWCSEHYFSGIADEIRCEFAFAHPPEGQNKVVMEHILSCAAICVHVRRGDLLTHPTAVALYETCNVDYYQKAFERLRRVVADPVVFVFSDDPDWARANLSFPCETVYVTHNVGSKNYEDFRLMRACRHFIIANSTFSWWAAWLADFPGKQVIAPQRWFRDPNRLGDFVPESWIRM